jgi:tetratricopeptide (TPR) repeat protein
MVAGASPASATRLLREAGEAFGQRRFDVAARAATSLLALQPNHPEAHRLMGFIALMHGENGRAVEHLRRACAALPGDSNIQMALGSALFDSGTVEEGLTHLRRACALAPLAAAAWYNLGRALHAAAQPEEARDALRKALALAPSHAKARITLADAQAVLGDTASAVDHYREVLRQDPANAKAWFAIANLKTEAFSAQDAARLREGFERAEAASEARIQLGFALAKAMEDQRDYAAAFEALRQANAAKRQSARWDAAAEAARVESIVRAFDAPPPPPLHPSMGEEVIFVVSLPRSGSTLLEQILASHPRVEGANEIDVLARLLDEESKRRGSPFPQWVPDATAGDWARLGGEYLARTRRWRQVRPVSTDKSLDNWALVGAIAAMLPGARIINSRRDPVETCFACYRQLFRAGAGFSYDLDDMAAHYAGYARLSRFWQERFPQRYREQRYEDLQHDPEGQIRQILDFCGLEFDAACLAFHATERAVLSTASAAQVRQPMRKDTARSHFYAAELEPLRSRLRQAGVLSGP